jgi:hypothetical protein
MNADVFAICNQRMFRSLCARAVVLSWECGVWVTDTSQYVSPDTSQSLLSCQSSTLLNLVSEYFYCMFAAISILVTRRVQQIIRHMRIIFICNSLLTTYFVSNFFQIKSLLNEKGTFISLLYYRHAKMLSHTIDNTVGWLYFVWISQLSNSIHEWTKTWFCQCRAKPARQPYSSHFIWIHFKSTLKLRFYLTVSKLSVLLQNTRTTSNEEKAWKRQTWRSR